MSPLVHIIILNWNDYKSTLDCIESLKSQSYTNYKIIVMDNASSNNSINKLSNISQIELRCNTQNLGFAGGNNKAIKSSIEAGADYVWILNNDATAGTDCLEKLVIAAQKDPKIGLLSPVLFEKEPNDKIQHCNTHIDFSIPVTKEAIDIATAQQWQSETPEQIIIWGTALLIPKYTVEAIGLLDEHLFAYAEDTDYSLRSIKAGLKNVTVFDASVWHQGHVGHRSPHYYYYVVRNSFYLWKKHLSLLKYLKICRWNVHQTKKQITALKGHEQQVAACLLGLWDGFRCIGGEYNPQRKAPWFMKLFFEKH